MRAIPPALLYLLLLAALPGCPEWPRLHAALPSGPCPRDSQMYGCRLAALILYTDTCSQPSNGHRGITAMQCNAVHVKTTRAGAPSASMRVHTAACNHQQEHCPDWPGICQGSHSSHHTTCQACSMQDLMHGVNNDAIADVPANGALLQRTARQQGSRQCQRCMLHTPARPSSHAVHHQPPVVCA
jgi:hypothetical protein